MENLYPAATSNAPASAIVFAGELLTEFVNLQLQPVLHRKLHCIRIDELQSHLSAQSMLTLPEIVLLEVDDNDRWVNAVKVIKNNSLLSGIIVVVLANHENPVTRRKAMELRVHDMYTSPFPVGNITERLDFLVKFKLIRPKLIDLSNQVDLSYRTPAIKRAFDILVAGTALLALSPILLVVALLIKLDSKGPVFYVSKRVGTGYKVFDFYKFRSMKSDADKEITNLSAQNQYAGNGDAKAAFVKIKNDPRVTRLGNFLRNSSIDELPQLLNVLKGDMSLVGNRPLPLYEAEMLTSNEWSMRFLGPAGLTGLWQISKRGREEMSERERMKLDNFYAKKHSFWFDMKLLLRTVPAVFQKEKV